MIWIHSLFEDAVNDSQEEVHLAPSYIPISSSQQLNNLLPSQPFELNIDDCEFIGYFVGEIDDTRENSGMLIVYTYVFISPLFPCESVIGAVLHVVFIFASHCPINIEATKITTYSRTAHQNQIKVVSHAQMLNKRVALIAIKTI